MQPLTPAGHEGKYQDAVTEDVRGGIVLPRALRKPVRQIRRFFNGGFRVTRRGLAYCAAAFVLLASGAGIHLSGGGDAVMARVAPGLGIAVTKIEVSGNRELSDSRIAGIVAPEGNLSILGYDVAEARRKLKAQSWIADATVSRVYPDTLAIKVEERVPFALWQGENGLQMIDREGTVLEAYDGRTHAMPLLVGAGAQTAGEQFVTLMNRYPSISARAKAYVMVGERRWDVELDNGITIMLPEVGADRELAELVEADRRHALLSRDISRVDLRIADRIAIRLSGPAMELVQEKREKQLDVLKASAKERDT